MKYSVDRIEDNIVVLENVSNGEIIEKNKIELPEDIHEGSILNFVDDKIVVDVEEEVDRRESLRERLERLKNLKK